MTAMVVGAAFALATIVSVAHASGHSTVVGTQHRDVIAVHNGGFTVVWGLGGDDKLTGGRGTDILHGGRGNDVLHTGSGGAKEAAYGGRGRDRIFDWESGESPGYLNGGAGRHDVCVGDKHDTFVRCERIRFKK